MSESLNLRTLKESGRATITVEEAGLLLGCGRAAAYNCVKNQEIPSLHLGRKILIPVPGLMRMLGYDE